MDKVLEDYLWDEIDNVPNNNWRSPIRRFPRTVINEMLDKGWIKSPKQAHRTLEKWVAKGKYEYGCCLDLGWKVDRSNCD